MKIYYSDIFVLPLPEGHRFPIGKYALLRERVAMSEFAPDVTLLMPPSASDEELLRGHLPGYISAIRTGTIDAAALRRIGFPWSSALVERSRRSVGATLAGARSALDEGFAVSLAGGTHHAFPDHGEGFCVFNDVTVAIRTLQAEARIQRAAVIDLDVHQGNGTAASFSSDPAVFTLSVHGENNFPFHKETSDLDLALPDGTRDDEFLAAVEHGLHNAFTIAPDLAIYIAGADPYEGDRLGRLAVSKAALAERDRMVYDACARAGSPVMVVMGGGYASNINDTVDIQLQSIAEAARRSRSATRTSL